MRTRPAVDKTTLRTAHAALRKTPRPRLSVPPPVAVVACGCDPTACFVRPHAALTVVHRSRRSPRPLRAPRAPTRP
eukprot:scaffold50378_cov70-Phaeocystis_antarctica.AAC.5